MLAGWVVFCQMVRLNSFPRNNAVVHATPDYVGIALDSLFLFWSASVPVSDCAAQAGLCAGNLRGHCRAHLGAFVCIRHAPPANFGFARPLLRNYALLPPLGYALEPHLVARAALELPRSPRILLVPLVARPHLQRRRRNPSRTHLFLRRIQISRHLACPTQLNISRRL